MAFWTKFRVDESGQAAVELGMTMSLLLLLATGMMSFGFAVNNYVTLAESTGEGGRKFAVSRGQGGDPCSLAVASMAASAPYLKNTGSSATGLSYSITVGGVTYAGTAPTCPNASLGQGLPVTIQSTYPCNLNIFKFGTDFNTPPNYQKACLIAAYTTEVLQ